MEVRTITVTYRIDKIKQLSYSIAEKPSNFTIDRDDVEFNLTTTLLVPEDYRGVIIHLIINARDKRDGGDLFSFSVENRFDVLNYEEAVSRTPDNRYVIPDNFLIEIITISIGTARGILVIRNSGTYLNDAVLSIFNPLDIVNGLKEHNKGKLVQQSD